MAVLTHDGGIHRDFLAGTRVGLRQGDRGAQQRVIARLHTRTRTASSATAGIPEEGLEDIAETKATPGRATGALLHRVAPAIHNVALIRIQQHLLGQRDLAELLRRLLGVIHIRVVLARQTPVRLLNLRIRGVLIHTQDAVVIACHSRAKSFLRRRESG